MQLLLKEIQDNFEDFVTDPEQQFMILNCSNESAGWVMKGLEFVENDPENPDIFLGYGIEFKYTKTYVKEICSNIELQLEYINEELKKTDRPTYEVSTEIDRKGAHHYEERLWATLRRLREAIEPERQLIPVFFPLETEREQDYFDLINYLIDKITRSKIEGIKMIFRETQNALFTEKYRDQENFVVYSPKADFDAMTESLQKQAESEKATPEEKAQAQMLLAGIDVANKDFDSALNRNLYALNYFKSSNQRIQQSVSFNNIGDLFYFQQKYPEAQKNYERAIEISVAEESQPMVIYQGINLGNSLFAQQQYDEAFLYYQSSEKLAEINIAVIQQIQALERMGDVKYAQEKLDEAIETWEKAAEICRENGYKLGLLGILERLERAYTEKDELAKARKAHKELESCRAEIEEIEPNLAMK